MYFLSMRVLSIVLVICTFSTSNIEAQSRERNENKASRRHTNPSDDCKGDAGTRKQYYPNNMNNPMHQQNNQQPNQNNWGNNNNYPPYEYDGNQNGGASNPNQHWGEQRGPENNQMGPQSNYQNWEPYGNNQPPSATNNNYPNNMQFRKMLGGTESRKQRRHGFPGTNKLRYFRRQVREPTRKSMLQNMMPAYLPPYSPSYLPSYSQYYSPSYSQYYSPPYRPSLTHLPLNGIQFGPANGGSYIPSYELTFLP